MENCFLAILNEKYLRRQNLTEAETAGDRFLFKTLKPFHDNFIIAKYAYVMRLNINTSHLLRVDHSNALNVLLNHKRKPRPKHF